MRSLLIDGVPLRADGTRLVKADWHDLLDWSMSWDMRDAVIYNDGTDDRVDHIPDRSGDYPLIRDTGFFGDAPGPGDNLPGPLYIASSARFKGRPACVGDGSGIYEYSVLATTEDPTDSGTHFAIAQPYLWAVLVRTTSNSVASTAWDAQQGNLGTTVTVGHEASASLPYQWGCTTGLRNPEDLWPSTTFDQNEDQTAALIGLVDGANSWFEYNTIWQNDLVVTGRDTSFALAADAPAREMFLGWTTPGCYFACGGIVAGTPSESEITAVRNWMLQYVTPQGALSAEP